MKHYHYLKRRVFVLGLSLTAGAFLHGQAPAQEDEEEVFELSPFVVAGEETSGYVATSTLGGTRIRTELRDLSTPLTAITAEFLQDTGSRSTQDLLVYTTNTEVGGLYGNWGGFGNTQDASDRGALMRPDNNTRVRGLESADNTRNFFLTDVPWDSYNVDRVEIQRGPNSILFGVGSPAGIINTATTIASMNGNFGRIEAEMSKNSSMRFVLDYNAELIDDLLAVRISALRNDKNFQQEPAFSLDERFYATATFEPQVLPKEWAGKLNVRATWENGDIESNNPRILPPVDGISLWFEDIAGDGVDNLIGLGKMVYDPFLFEVSGGGSPFRAITFPYEVKNPYYQPGTDTIDSGDLNNGGLGFFFNNGSSDPFFVSMQSRRVFPGGIGADGSIDGNIEDPYTSPKRVAGFNAYTRAVNRIDENNGVPATERRFPLADRNYYKDLVLTDPSVFNFYDQLIDGDNKREYRDWEYKNVAVAQTFLDNRIGVEFVYDDQEYHERRGGAAWNRPYLSIDINKNLQHMIPRYGRVPDPAWNGTEGSGREDGLIDPSTYSMPGFTPSAAQPYPNANAGRAMVAGGLSSNDERNIDRETYRVTAFGEFRASDVFDKDSLLAMILGTHTVTGLYTREEVGDRRSEFRPAATTYEWAQFVSRAGETSRVNESYRGVSPFIYLSDSLLGSSITSAAGLNLPPVKTYYVPSGGYNTDFLDVTWKRPTNPNAPGYVNPADPYITWSGAGSIAPGWAGVQADNPANYVGRTLKPVHIMNADMGDQAALTYNYDVTEQITKSTGFVWQGKFLNGHLVPTVGWRKDELETSTADGIKDNVTGVVSTTETTPLTKFLENEGETTSWGVVLHTPNDWLKDIPVISGLSVYYNYGENQRVQARYNYDGEPLANPSAESEDYGIVLSVLDDKLTFKVGKYETKVKNGNLPGGSSLLGGNQYYLYQLEGWGLSNVLLYAAGLSGLDPNQNWHWGWAHIAEGWANEWWTNPNTGSPDPTLPVYRNHPETVYQLQVMDAFIEGMDSTFFENYAIPVDVDAVKAAYATWRSTGNIQPLMNEVSDVFKPGGYTTSVASTNNGQINGISPNGTIDNTSEGYEFEINYRPMPNWNIQINAAKTDAYRESLGAPMREFIENQYAKLQGPAGDIRLWWGGDSTIRKYYEDNIIAAVRLQEESIGHQVPELRPWSFALVTNYSFVDGMLEGFNIGGSYRWQDEQILGYGLKSDNSGLDVNRPLYGDSEGHFDLWMGYQTNLTDTVTWRIQLNLRNVAEDDGLVGISANPDGTMAAYRIQEGMTWALTNTIRF